MTVRHIKSSANGIFKELKKIVRSGREWKKKGFTLLEGGKLVSGFLEADGRPLQILCSESAWAKGDCEPHYHGEGTVTVLRDGLFKSLSTVKSPSGVMAIVAVPAETPPAGDGPAVVLDGIQDPGNLGTIFRSAAATGVRQIFVTPPGADPWSPKVLRAGMGAHFVLKINRSVDLASLTARGKGPLLALDHRAPVSIYDIDLSGDIVLFVGSEGTGLSQSVAAGADLQARIPMPGWEEPLNAAMAATICLFEALRQRQAR